MAAVSDWLLGEGVHSVVEWAVTTVIAVSGAAYTRTLVCRGSVEIGAHTGRTRQSPEVFVIGLLCGAVAIACLIWGLLDPATLLERGAATAWLILIGSFAHGFIVMTVYAQHRWAWDQDRLTWRGAFRSASIRWAALAYLGKSWDGQFVARDTGGHRVRWTTFTLQHQALHAVAEAALWARAK